MKEDRITMAEKSRRKYERTVVDCTTLTRIINSYTPYRSSSILLVFFL